MKKYLIALATLSLAASSFAASGDFGDIRSIDAVPDSAHGITYPNKTQPLSVGESFYVLVRLLNDDYMTATPHKWEFVPRTGGSTLLQDSFYLPKLGLSIGGKIVYATYTDVGPNGELGGNNTPYDKYTDLYFKYVVEPGDLGSPVKILSKGNTVVGSATTDFLLINVNTKGGLTSATWNLQNLSTTNLATFRYTTQYPPSEGDYPANPAGGPRRSYDIVMPGITVKTLDFEKQYKDETDLSQRIWRDVYPGDPMPVDAALPLQVEGPVTGAVVYVWSDDPTKVLPVEGDDGVLCEDDGSGIPVLKVQVNAGVGKFCLKGGALGTEGDKVKIYMSSRRDRDHSDVGDTLEASALERWVRVTKAPEPYVTISDYAGETRGIALEAKVDYETPSVFKVRLSTRPEPDDHPVRVSLNPQFYRGNTEVELAEIDPGDAQYIAVLTDPELDPTDPSNKAKEVELPIGVKEATFFVYPLGRPADSTITQLRFSPSFDNPDDGAFYTGARNDARCTIKDVLPTVEEFAIPATVTQEDEVTVSFTVADNWRDLQEGLNTNGYEVVVSLNGAKLYETNGYNFAANLTAEFPITIPANLEGEVSGVVTVKDATHTKGFEQPFTVSAMPKPIYAAKPYFQAPAGAYNEETGMYTFCEGDQIPLYVNLSLPNTTGDLYAFLVPADAMSSNLVESAALTNGLPIVANGSNPTNSTASLVTFLDGDARKEPLTKGRFNIVLGNKPSVNDEGFELNALYSCGSVKFTVTNAAPTVVGVSKGNEYVEVEEDPLHVVNGGTLRGAIPSGVPVAFTAQLADLGIIDATNGTARVKWMWTDGDAALGNEVTDYSEPLTVSTNGLTTCMITFNTESHEQTVYLYVQDRDQRAVAPNSFGTTAVFSFKVKVAKMPNAMVTFPDGISDGKGGGIYHERTPYTKNQNRPAFLVKLSEFPLQSDRYEDPTTHEFDPKFDNDNPMIVKVTLGAPEDSSRVTFPNGETTTYVTFASGAKAAQGTYVYFDPETQNGGPYDSGADVLPQPIAVSVKVINGDPTEDNPLKPGEKMPEESRNKEGLAWCDYYAESYGSIYMLNEDPKSFALESATTGIALHLNATNTWTTGQAITLKWTVEDIARDLTNGVSYIELENITDSNGKTVLMFDAEGNTFTAGNTPLNGNKMSGTFEFKVPADSTEVKVRAYDGEGGMLERMFYINIVPTKKVQISPVRPVNSTETKYDTANGLGRGHVYVDDSTGNYVLRQFRQTWSYPETAQQAHLFAVGYPAATGDAFDNGNLDPGYTGAALGPTGNEPTSATDLFNYGKADKADYNNYFYTWASTTGDDGKVSTDLTILAPEPMKTVNSMADRLFPLDNGQGNAAQQQSSGNGQQTKGYQTIQVEAIFSREFRKGDFLGDINADGIPDLIARKFKLGGSEEGKLPEDDLARLDTENNDGDYLPTLDRDRFASLIPGVKDSWVGEHQAFTAKRELRGYHDGLNDAVRLLGIGDVDLHPDYYSDDLEKRIASRDYSEAEMMAWAETGYAKDWTPENPTDPTMEDTDEDGLPDGYEYYFWYWAHVGNIVDGKLVHLTGERYNPHHPEKGDLITWQEIEKRMNPTVPNGEFGENLDLLDSDNDGLVDTLEFELGTNPFHWDTDGDGLPDGYEVMFTNLDPLKKATDDVHDDGTRNDDGDFMAKMQMKKMTVIGTVNPAETNPNEAGHVIYYATYATIDNDADFAYGDASPGWLVKVETKDGDKTVVKDYMIADGTLDPEKVFRSVENGSTTNYYLAADFRRTEVFEAGATNENSNAAMVRGVGVQLMQGTPLNAEPEQTTWCEKKLERQLVGNDEVFLDRSYAVWVYGKKGDFVLAANADIPEHAIVVDGPKTADVTLLHHHVYQRRGFYFEAEEMEPDNTIIIGESSLITEAKGGGLVRGRDMGFGFNPLTAWNILPNGYVGARYVRTPKPYPQTVITASAGKPVDTEGYSLMDEFLLMNYRLRTGLINADALVVNILAGKTLEKIWGANTTRGCYTEEQLAGAEGGQAKGADTDGDGVPDGWELYVAAGPTTYVPEDEGGDAAANNLFVNKAFYSPNDPNDKSTDADLDPITLRSIGMADGLSLLAEFCGTDSMTAYANCPSVPKTHPYKPKPDSPEWVNKYLPTDPWSNDTDCDGVADGEEGAGTFRYGSPHDNGKYWVSGGGMNPCSWDTDMDGLPDAWEYQYHGIYATPQNRQLLDAIELQDYKRHVNKAVNHVIISAEDGSTNEVVSTDSFFVGGMDATTPDSYTLNDVKSTPQIEPTLQDNKDFDFDGLDPWQEYLTGFIRAFRYDDPLSPWTVPQKDDFIGTDDEYLEALLTGEPLNPLDYTAKNRGGSNPNLVFGKFDAFGAYGSKCRRKWDLAHGLWYFFPDGPNHCLRIPYDEDGNRLIPPFITVPTNVYGLKLMDAGYDSDDLYYESAPTMYATCDPRMKDSDGDGMDDYYELFHGLNPLYGGETGLDLIRSVWTGSKVSATLNYWTVHRRDEARGNSNQAKLYDFACFPWMAGDPQADPDGDDLRNIDEAIQANAESVRTWLHTDPTPLWMTDTSYPGSIVNAYYAFPTSADQMAGDAPTEIEVPGQDDPVTLPTPMRLPYGHRWQLITAYNWAFEENEGYDSDHDGLSDYQEAASKASAQSDPQDEDDPHRRQAMYFPGDKSALQAKVDPIFGAGGTEFFFLEFTAECWVRPEDTTYEQVILERTIKGGASNPGDLRYYRRNFEIGINPAGQFYAAYDHNGTGEPRVIATAQNKASVNTWTHLAATYDGTMLRLYVNGEVVAKQPSTLHPATPALSIITGIDYDILLSTLEWDNRLGHEITNLADENAIIFGASAVEGVLASALTLHPEVTDWSAYGKFYKGFLDEVRIWDGARTDKEIADNFRTRFTAKECLANRKAVFNAWKEGAHRNVDTSETAVKLPAELAYHYTFDGLLAAAAAENVATSPYGFTAAMEVGGKALVARPEGYVNPWWYALPVHSTVYNEYAYIPWIPNTMTHLPHLDGTTCDSTYWSEDYAGFVSAFSIGQKKYDFPRTHEYATVYRPVLTALDHQPTRPMIIAEIEGMTDEAYDAYRFTQRSLANNSTDLLPLGGAYARYCTDLWDDEGATTTWDVTGTDDDNDLLADWWEELVVAGGKDGIVYATVDGDPITVEDLKADTVIKRNGVLMSAIEAFRRDLAGGAVEIGDESYLATTQFRQTVDEDRDGIPDWWEQMYGIDTGSAADADADPDGDGLSNFQEFLITEVFRYANLSPLLPRSDGYTLDYLLKVGELYVGEIFTDHDGMDNVWESQFNKPDFVNRYKYDPLEDRDGDGWSNYAEYRAGTDPTETEKLSIDGYILPEHPIPVVKATLAYNGNKAILAPVVFMAWNEKADPNMQEAPDAIWTLGTTANTQSSSSSSGKDQTTAGSANAAATMVTYEKFVGRKPKGTKTYYLTGGAVSEGSFKLFFLDKGYSVVTVDTASNRIVDIENGRPEEAIWYYHIYDRDGLLMMIGNSLYGDAEETTVGTIDYVTGEVVIDFDHPSLCGDGFGTVPTTNTNTSNGNASGNRVYHYYNMDNAYVRFTWQSTKAGTTAAGTYYLADADKPSDEIPSRGYLREGKASFACFIDDDGDGKYTAGELYGFVRGVDVGWQGAEVAIEVTETSPVFARVDITTGDSDRKLMWGADSGDIDAALVVSNADAQAALEALSGGKYNHVRVVPYLVAGTLTDTAYYANERAYKELVRYVPNRVVAEFDVNTETHPYITEADFIKNGQFDIDWDGFETQILRNINVSSGVGDVTAVKYRLVLGKDGPIGPEHNLDTSTVVRAFSTLIERRYEPSNARTKPSQLTLASGQVLTAARPTFLWRLDESTSANGYAASAALFGCSYTAFQIEVADAETNEKIYDSGVLRAPARDAQGRFAWQAPLCAGSQTAFDKIFARSGNWKWRVAMYNAKFKPQDRETRNGWSEWANFSTAVNEQQEVDDHGYSMIKATVKYAGPEVVLKNCAKTTQSKGIVRVQAFANGDFAGEPAAEALVTDKLALVNTTDHAANAELCGLAPGRWYVRAYVDSNGNHMKDAWESWGYAREAVTVELGKKAPAVELYIDDADTDNDALPDAWEVATYGNLDHENAYVDPKGEIVLATQTYTSITNGTIGLPKNFPSASLEFFRNFDAARLLLGLDPSETTGDSIADIRAAVELNVKPGSVKVTAMEVDAANRRVTFTVVGDLEAATNNLLAPAYAIPQGTQLAVRVWRKSSLVESEWSWLSDYPVTVSTSIETTVTVDVKEELAKSGFYKVEIVKGSEILKK